MEELKVRKLMNKIEMKMVSGYLKSKTVLGSNSGEGMVDSAVKILISIVIGALLLAGLYMLFGDVILFSSLRNHDRDCYA